MARAKGNVYEHGGRRFVRVTSVTDIIDKPALRDWYGRLTGERVWDEWESALALRDAGNRDAFVKWAKSAPNEVKRKKADRGTEVHSATQSVEMGMPADMLPPHLAGYRSQFERYLAEWQPNIITTEATVFSYEHGYAGTLDTLAEIPSLGGLYIIDKKTGRAVYDEHALQQCAYARADFIEQPNGALEKMPKVHGAIILHLTETGYEMVPVDIGGDTWEAFLGALRIVRWKAMRCAVGAPLEPLRAVEVGA